MPREMMNSEDAALNEVETYHFLVSLLDLIFCSAARDAQRFVVVCTHAEARDGQVADLRASLTSRLTQNIPELLLTSQLRTIFHLRIR